MTGRAALPRRGRGFASRPVATVRSPWCSPGASAPASARPSRSCSIRSTGDPRARVRARHGPAATGRDPVVVTSPATAAGPRCLPSGVAFALQERPTDPATPSGPRLPRCLPTPTRSSSSMATSVDRGRPGRRRPGGAPGDRRRDRARLVRRMGAAALGRVIRTPDGERVARLVEAKDATRDELLVSEVNAGLYAFDACWLRARDRAPDPVPRDRRVLRARSSSTSPSRTGARVVAHEAPDDGALDGINNRAQLAEASRDAARAHQPRVAPGGRHHARPATAYVDAEVELARDVTLEPNVILRGGRGWARGAASGQAARSRTATWRPRCQVWASVLERATVEEGTTIGPFAHLRSGTLHRRRTSSWATSRR